MKTYKCDKCKKDYLITNRLDNDMCSDCAEAPIPEASKLNYPIRELLSRCGDFCPDNDMCSDCAEAPIPEASKLNYPIRELLSRCGDFCPDCEYDLFTQIHLMMRFLIQL